MSDPSYNSKVYQKQGGDTLVVASGGKIEDAHGAQVVRDLLQVDIADLSADASYFVVAPHAGVISKIWSVIDGAVSTADITITPKIATVAVTGGQITITQSGSAAGDVDSAEPSAANTVTAGQAIELAVAGGGSGGSPRGHVCILIDRA